MITIKYKRHRVVKKPKRLKKKNIISMSLYGTGARYSKGAIWNMQNYKKYYPGWTLRIYCEYRHPLIKELRDGGCEVIIQKIDKERGPAYPMFWRFFAIEDPLARYIIVRDIDSKLNEKGAAAVKDWIKSGLDFHIMEDYYWPTKWHKMSGSGFGIKGGVITDIKNIIARWTKNKYIKYYDDEYFLSTKIWPLIKKSCLTHSSFRKPGSKKFPITKSKITKAVGAREFR